MLRNEEQKILNEDSLTSPREGDLWQELLNFILVVVGVSKNHVAILRTRESVAEKNKFVWKLDAVKVLTRDAYRKILQTESGYIFADVMHSGHGTYAGVNVAYINNALHLAEQLFFGYAEHSFSEMSEYYTCEQSLNLAALPKPGDLLYYRGIPDTPYLVVLGTQGDQILVMEERVNSDGDDLYWQNDIRYARVISQDLFNHENGGHERLGGSVRFPRTLEPWVTRTFSPLDIERGFIRARIADDIKRSKHPNYPLDMAEAYDHEFQALMQPAYRKDLRVGDEWIAWAETPGDGHDLILLIYEKMSDEHYAVLLSSKLMYPNSSNQVREWDTDQISFYTAREINSYIDLYQHRRRVAFRGHSGHVDAARKMTAGKVQESWTAFVQSKAGPKQPKQPMSLLQAKELVLKIARREADKMTENFEREQLREAVAIIERPE